MALNLLETLVKRHYWNSYHSSNMTFRDSQQAVAFDWVVLQEPLWTERVNV
jgi:hypothetical protein